MQIVFHIIYSKKIFISYFNKWNSQKFREFCTLFLSYFSNYIQIVVTSKFLLFFFFSTTHKPMRFKHTEKKKVHAIILITFSHYKTSIVFLYTIFWVVEVYANKVVKKKKKKIKHSCKKKIKIGFCVYLWDFRL